MFKFVDKQHHTAAWKAVYEGATYEVPAQRVVDDIMLAAKKLVLSGDYPHQPKAIPPRRGRPVTDAGNYELRARRCDDDTRLPLQPVQMRGAHARQVRAAAALRRRGRRVSRHVARSSLRARSSARRRAGGQAGTRAGRRAGGRWAAAGTRRRYAAAAAVRLPMTLARGGPSEVTAYNMRVRAGPASSCCASRLWEAASARATGAPVKLLACFLSVIVACLLPVLQP